MFLAETLSELPQLIRAPSPKVTSSPQDLLNEALKTYSSFFSSGQSHLKQPHRAGRGFRWACTALSLSLLTLLPFISSAGIDSTAPHMLITLSVSFLRNRTC